MQVLRFSSTLASLVLLAACVTVNIYFPAAQAQEAADRIVGDILGDQPGDDSRQESDSKSDGESSIDESLSRSLANRVVDFFVPTAQAGQPDFSVNTPEIRSLEASMKNRHQSLAPHYASGAIGFTRDALVGVRDLGVVPLKQRAKVRKLVDAENRDRNRLYRAIAKANGHPEWEKDVRAVFARTWVRKAQGGWWHQDSGGQWVRK